MLRAGSKGLYDCCTSRGSIVSVGQPFSCANSWQEGPRRRPTKTYPILYLINFNHVSCLAQEVHALPTNRGPSKAKHSNGSLRRASSDPKFSYLIPLKRRNNTKQHQAKHLDLGLKVVSTWSLPLSLLSFFMSVFLFCFLSLSLSLLICSFVFFFSLSLSLSLSPSPSWCASSCRKAPIRGCGSGGRAIKWGLEGL